jgi:hypothetical protein
MGSNASARCALVVVLLAGAAPAWAQELPAGPIRALDGRLTIAGEVVATAGSTDTTAFFNYTDYEHNALRMVRLALSGEWRPADRVALVGELRAEDFSRLTPHAAYVRVRPWAAHRFDVQVGRIPPVFGAFSRRAYGSADGVIGYPLAYQYLTSLRPDAVPATSDDLLLMRARGWRSEFPIGSPDAAPGIPLVTAFQWDTGVQAQWASDRATLAAAITNGTLSVPRFDDDNDGKQVSARLSLRPTFGLVAGVSAARGAWVSRRVLDALPDTSRQASHTQTTVGADVEYSRDHWIVRAEAVWSEWRVPTPESVDAPSLPVSALGAFVEGRYRFSPRVFAAVRLDGLTFSAIRGSLSGGRPTSWDAPVRRVEAAVGYYVQRNLVARLSVQHNQRDGGRVRSRTFVAGQFFYWF